LLATALDEVHQRLRTPVLEALARLPVRPPQVAALVDLMWEAFRAPAFKAVVEVR